MSFYSDDIAMQSPGPVITQLSALHLSSAPCALTDSGNFLHKEKNLKMWKGL